MTDSIFNPKQWATGFSQYDARVQMECICNVATAGVPHPCPHHSANYDVELNAYKNWVRLKLGQGSKVMNNYNQAWCCSCDYCCVNRGTGRSCYDFTAEGRKVAESRNQIQLEQLLQRLTNAIEKFEQHAAQTGKGGEE